MEEQGGQKVGQGPSGKDGQTVADLGPLLESREVVPTATHVETQTSKGHGSPNENAPASYGLGDQAPEPI